MYFDVHAHYDDERFEEDRDELLRTINSKGVGWIINSGSSLETSKNSIDMAKKYPFMFATVGVHPDETGNLPENYLEQLEAMIKEPKVVAVGEIGLDYYGESVDRDIQIGAFKAQLELARKHNLAVVIHDRDAHGDVMDILREEKVKRAGKPVEGVMHCYSGSVEMAREVLELGMYISVGGVLTFKNAKKLVEVVEEIPIEKILTETDCPYLSPVPFRGKRNDSSNIKYVVEKMSELKGMAVEEIEAIMIENAKMAFRISDL